MTKQEQLKFIEDNYPAYTRNRAKRRVRHEFFQNIRTEIQAYLLGFHASDGCILEKRKTFHLALHEDDSEIIYLFKDFISPDARTFYTPPHKGFSKGKEHQTHGAFGLEICSVALCEDLVKLGYGYRKSYDELHLPKLNEDLVLAFIRGYFDGDGCISYGLDKTAKNPKIRAHWTLYSKTNTLLLEVQKLFSEKYDIDLHIYYRKSDKMYEMSTFSREAIKKISKILYNDAHFYLTRKYNKISHYVNTEVTQLIDEYRNAQKVNVSESNNPSKSVELPTDNSGKVMCAEQ